MQVCACVLLTVSKTAILFPFSIQQIIPYICNAKQIFIERHSQQISEECPKMLRFYNIFKLAFLCEFRLGTHGWRRFIGCFSVEILFQKKNNLAKSVTFFIFSSESRIDAADADFGNMGYLLSELWLTVIFVIYLNYYIEGLEVCQGNYAQNPATSQQLSPRFNS